jgi:hypothetical protein
MFIQKKSKIIGVKLLLIAFVLFASFGAMAMQMDMTMKDGIGMMRMGSCPFMQGGSSICGMSITEHIEAWTSMLSNVPTENIFTLILSILLLGTFLTFTIKQLRRLSELRTYIVFFLYRHFTSYRFTDPYIGLFSQGVLNSKVF